MRDQPDSAIRTGSMYLIVLNCIFMIFYVFACMCAVLRTLTGRLLLFDERRGPFLHIFTGLGLVAESEDIICVQLLLLFLH